MVRVNYLILSAVLALLAAPAAAEPSAVAVRFAWEPIEARTLITDRGFAVRIDKMSLTNAGFALIPCDEQSRRGVGGIVRIGHFSGALPNQLSIEKRESPIENVPFAIEDFDPPDLAYCQAHTVLGAPPGSLNLTIDGAFRVPGDEAWRPLTVATPEAFGAFVDIVALDGAQLRGHLGTYRTITVMRPTTGWFDGIDLATATSVAIGRAVLRRIASGTVVTLSR